MFWFLSQIKTQLWFLLASKLPVKLTIFILKQPNRVKVRIKSNKLIYVIRAFQMQMMMLEN